MRGFGSLALLSNRTILTICLLVTTNSHVRADEAADAVKQRSDGGVRRHLTFDIASQPLVSALEAYGATSGFQVVYDSALAKGRTSAEVKGAYTPEDALRRMLAGTSLSPRYMAADGIVLVPDPTIGVKPNTASLRVVTSYYGRIQAELREAFCAEARLRSGGYRLAIGLWIGASGFVTRSALLDTTGDPDLDATLEGAMRSMNIGETPPVGFAQPVVMTIDPDVTKDCRSVQPRRVTP